MADIIQLRGGTAAAWTSANPILAQKELGVETDTKKMKIGDGVTAWNALPYIDFGGKKVRNIDFATEGGLGQALTTDSIFPSSPVDGEYFGLTTDNIVYQYNEASTTWSEVKIGGITASIDLWTKPTAVIDATYTNVFVINYNDQIPVVVHLEHETVTTNQLVVFNHTSNNGGKLVLLQRWDSNHAFHNVTIPNAFSLPGFPVAINVVSFDGPIVMGYQYDNVSQTGDWSPIGGVMPALIKSYPNCDGWGNMPELATDGSFKRFTLSEKEYRFFFGLEKVIGDSGDPLSEGQYPYTLVYEDKYTPINLREGNAQHNPNILIPSELFSTGDTIRFYNTTNEPQTFGFVTEGVFNNKNGKSLPNLTSLTVPCWGSNRDEAIPITITKTDGTDGTRHQWSIMYNEGLDTKNYQNILVAKEGGDFSSIKAALDYITDASESKPYIIGVMPGWYNEDPFTMKQHVSVVGLGSYYNTVIATTDNTQHFITGNAWSDIRGVAIEGPTDPNMAAIAYMNVYANYPVGVKSYPFIVVDTAIRRGSIGIYAYSDGQYDPAYPGDNNYKHDRTKIHCINVVNMYPGTGAPVGILFLSEGKANITCMSCAAMSGRADTVTGLTTGFWAKSDANNLAEMTLDLCSALAASTGIKVTGVAGKIAEVRMTACNMTGGTTGLDVAYGYVEAAGCVIRDAVTTNHIVVDAYSTVQFDGTMNKAKLSVAPGGKLSAAFSDITSGEEGQVVFGELWLGNDKDTSIPLKQYGLATYSTGWVNGGVVTQNATALTIDVSAGYGFINDGLGTYKVAWGATTAQALSDNLKEVYVYADSTGTLQFNTVEPDYNVNILLAVVETGAGRVISISDHKIPLNHHLARIAGWMEEAVGPISTEGGVVTENSTANKLDVTPGEFYRIFDKQTFAGGTAINFTPVSRGTAGGANYAALTDTVPITQYDSAANTLSSIPTGKFVKHNLWVITNANGDQSYHLVYAQEYDDSQLGAETGNNPTPACTIQKTGLRLAGIVVQEGVGVVSITDEKPKLGQMASGSTAVTEHNEMSGILGAGYYHISLAQVQKLDAIPTLGSAAQKDVPASGNATDTQVLLGTDTRLLKGGNTTTLYGAIPYMTNTDTNTLLTPNTTAVRQFLSMVGTGTNGAAPAWYIPSLSDFTAPGSTTQVMFNDGGSLAGNANFVFNKTSNHLEVGLSAGQGAVCLPANTGDEVAEPGELIIYAKSIAGRVVPKWIGPSGVDTPFQASLYMNKVMVCASTGTAYSYFGCSTRTDTGGTSTQTAMTTGSIKNQLPRVVHATGTTTNIICYSRHASGDMSCYLGNAVNMGGFFFVIRFGIQALGTGNIAFVGLSPRITPTYNANLNTYVNCVGVGYQASSGNWFLVQNSSSGTGTLTDLGSSFPLNTTDAMELVLFAPPNSTTIQYRLTNMTTGATTSGTITGRIPAVNTLLTPMTWVSNNASTTSCQIWVNKYSLETDY